MAKNILRRYQRHQAAYIDRFQTSVTRLFWASATGPALEYLADFAHMRNHIPEPFDVFAHGGNLNVGVTIAGLTLAARENLAMRQRSKQYRIPTRIKPESYIDRRQLRSFRRKWVPGVMAMALAVNTLTETKWGVETFPFAKIFGATPDPLDAAYSTGAAGLMAAFGWRKDKSRPNGYRPYVAGYRSDYSPKWRKGSKNTQ